MKTRIYLVKVRVDKKVDSIDFVQALVRAPNKLAAMRHIANGMMTATVATQDEIFQFAKDGCGIQEAGVEVENGNETNGN